MKPEAAGGRHGPFSEGYCPHLIAEGKTEWLGVRVVHCPEFIHPGDEKEVEFELMFAPQIDYRDLTVGASFSMHEGPKVVGTGIVFE